MCQYDQINQAARTWLLVVLFAGSRLLPTNTMKSVGLALCMEVIKRQAKKKIALNSYQNIDGNEITYKLPEEETLSRKKRHYGLISSNQ